jgi:kynurenine formamidase
MSDDITEAEIIGYMDALSNWGRWGADDQLGTLNFLTDEARRSAAALIVEGTSISCAWPLQSQIGQTAGDVQRLMLETGEGLSDPSRMPLAFVGSEWLSRTDLRARWAIEYVGYEFHGLTVTHLDAPCHYFWDGQMYNGASATLVSSAFGSQHCAVTVARHGIAGKGVLFDLDGLGRGAVPDDLERFEVEHGVRAEPGDIVLLRTGASRERHETGQVPLPFPGGWHPSVLPWLHARQVAAIGADVAQEAYTDPGYGHMSAPIHIVGLVAMGLWLIDNVDLEGVARRCSELGRYSFHLALHPLPIQGATGSAVNPIATF